MQGLSVHSKTAFANATKHSYPIQEQSDNCMTVQAPDGYKFLLVNEDGKDGAGERCWLYSHERKIRIIEMCFSINPFTVFQLLMKKLMEKGP